MLKKIYEKSEVWFAVLFIMIYVIGNSMLDQLSNEIGIEMILTIPFDILLLIVLFAFIKKNGLLEYYGLCKVKTPAKRVLFYIPLVIIATVNIWIAGNSTLLYGTKFANCYFNRTSSYVYNYWNDRRICDC